MTVDYKAKLVKIGYTPEEAADKIKQVELTINKVMADSTPDERNAIVAKKLRQLTTMSAGTKKFRVICIAQSDRIDRNDYQRKKALETYEEDPKYALDEGLVELKDGIPVALNTRRYLDNAQTMENRQFGKPLRQEFKREFLLVVEYQDEDSMDTYPVLVRAFGDATLKIGYECMVFGTWKGPGNIMNLRSSPNAVIRHPVENLWDLLTDLVIGDDLYHLLEDIDTIEPKTNIVTKGFVRMITQTSNGAMIILDDPDSDNGSIAGFSNSDEITTLLLDSGDVQTDDEVFVYGRFDKGEDAEGNARYNISIIGLVKNPSGEAVDDDIMSQIDDEIFG